MMHSTEKGRFLLLIIFCAAGSARTALAGDFQLTPNVSLSEEYNDNVLETAIDRKMDLITRVHPGLSLHYLLPDSSWDAAYNLDYAKYGRGTRSDEVSHSGLFKGAAALTGNLLFLDLNDVLSRVSQQLTRDTTADSVSVGQVDQNLATVSPYLLWRYSEKGSLRTGYSYTDVRYWHANGSGAVDRRQQDATAVLGHEVRSNLSLSAQYTFSSVQSQREGSTSHNASVGGKYQYADGCFLSGNIGNSWQDFSDGTRAKNLFWDVGIIHDFGTMLVTLGSRSAVNMNPQSISNVANTKVVSSTVDPQSISTKVTTHSARLDKKLNLWAFGLSGSYSHLVDTQSVATDQTTITLGASGSCEIRPSLVATLSASGDKVTGLAAVSSAGPVSGTTSNYPYHFTGIAGLSYVFNHGVTGGLTYTRAMYRFEPGRASGSLDINRAVLSLAKSF